MTGWIINNGTGMHWRQDGDPSGPPVLFLNSLGTDLRLWDDIMPHLQGFRVIRLDTRGHGLSDAPKGAYSLDVLTEDAMALISHLGIDRLSVVGVSLGGMMAQMLAAEFPGHINRVVLSNTAARMGTPQMWEDRITAVQSAGLDDIADAILDRWLAPKQRDAAQVGAWRNMLTRTSPDGYAGCCAALANADLTAQSARITCPALVIGGSEDGASPPDIVRNLAHSIPGAAYEEISGVGHLPMIEAPDIFAPLIHAFLKETAHA